MVEPGLYKHYKGDYYRVLFLAKLDGDRAPGPNGDVTIFADGEAGAREGFSIFCRPTEEGKVFDAEILRAKNSTDGKVVTGAVFVVYVSLSTSSGGRISVRELSEFEGRIASDELRFTKINPSCHACAYSSMEPNDDFLVCGHPDAGNPWGSYIRKEPLPHCPGYSKFEQHPLRNLDGSLKQHEPQAFASRGAGRSRAE